MKRVCVFNPVVWLALAAVVSVGCVSQRAGLEIPGDAEVVGGGLKMSFTAPEDGILYLVDQRKFVASQTMRAGESFEVEGSYDVGGGDMYLLENARLYFLVRPLNPVASSIEIEQIDVDAEPAGKSGVSTKHLPDDGPAHEAADREVGPEVRELEQALGSAEAGAGASLESATTK